MLRSKDICKLKCDRVFRSIRQVDLTTDKAGKNGRGFWLCDAMHLETDIRGEWKAISWAKLF